MGKKKSPVSTITLPTDDRLRSAQSKLLESFQSTRNAARDLEATNLAIINAKALEDLDIRSRVQPLSACQEVEAVIGALREIEDQAKDSAKEARETGKVAEHLRYSVSSLYRDVLARGEAERDRVAADEASRQQRMFIEGEVSN